MSSDVFVISAGHNPAAAAALQQAVELAGVLPAQIQDVVFGLDNAISQPALDALVRSAGLACPAASVMPGLRAIMFAAAATLSDDLQLSLAAGLAHEAAAAFVLASPEAVGRLNLLPRARIAARSLAGQEAALHQAGLSTEDVAVVKQAERGALLLLNDVLDELDAGSARWGLVNQGAAALLVERL